MKYRIFLLAIVLDISISMAAAQTPLTPSPTTAPTTSVAHVAVVPPPLPLIAADKAFVEDAAQDGTGQVWAVIGNPQFGLYQWKSDGWQGVVPPNGTKGYPVALGTTPAGAVICVWSESPSTNDANSGDGDHAVTVHQGADSRLVKTFSGPLHLPRVFADSRDNIWLTGQGGDIYRVPAGVGDSSSVEHVYHITPEEYFPNSNGSDGQYFYYDPLLATEDALGRMWFWTDQLAGAGNFRSLHGVLVWDGRKMNSLPALSGVPDKKIDCIAAPDKQHLWVAVHQQGIYEIDLDTLNPTLIAEPEPNAFQYTQKMFRLGAFWYVVSGQAQNYSASAPVGTLWRRGSDGWKKLITGLDYHPENHDWLRRPAVQTAAGIWIGALSNGAWFAPALGGAPQRLNWRRNCPVDSTERIFDVGTAAGGVIAFSLDDHGSGTPSIVATHLEVGAARLPNASIQTLATVHPLVKDTRGDLWNLIPPTAHGDGVHPLVDDGPGVLNEWDGVRWTGIQIPSGFQSRYVRSVDTDTLGRVWLVGDIDSASLSANVMIFDPATRNWQHYETFQKAVQAQAGLSADYRLRVLPVATASDAASLTAFSGDGHICYKGNNWQIYYFDGQTWHSWKRDDIRHDGQFSLDGPPFFRKDGVLCINMDRQRVQNSHGDTGQITWAWTEAGGWHAVPYEASENDFSSRVDSDRLTPPAGCVKPDFLSLTKASDGWFWLTSEHVLYRAKDNLCSVAFPKDDPTPFADGRRVDSAIVDIRGNTFLDTVVGRRREYVIIPVLVPPAAAPHLDSKPPSSGILNRKVKR